jgi:GMP synthase (glutamine-hydrolysing)
VRPGRSVGRVDSLGAVDAPRLLIVQHEDDCTPAWFGEWFLEGGLEYDVVMGHRSDPIPRVLDGYAGLVVLGGEMGANDDATCPWLTPSKALIAHTVMSGRWFLGICLGHQLAAVALGGEVVVNPRGRALGLTPVRLTEAGRRDELTSVIGDGARTLQWNSDIVSRLPAGATELATSPDGSIQAARFAARAWGLQFHPEASAEVFSTWINTAAVAGAADDPRLAAVAAELVEAEAELRRDWAALANRWSQLVASPVPVP